MSETRVLACLPDSAAAAAQGEVKDKRERLRGAQADFDRISELHSERRQAALAGGDPAQQERLRSFMVCLRLKFRFMFDRPLRLDI